MPYISPDVIKKAKEMDLLTYLQNYDPENLKYCSRNTYCTKEHDSLKISDGKWNWFSRGIGGRTALDYLIKVKEMSFIQAVEHITGQAASYTPIYAKCIVENDKTLVLPDKSGTTHRIYMYLMKRGIDREIIRYCIEQGLLMESLPYHNCVFIGYDENKKARYASYRATNERRILGECRGSDKEYSFRLEGSDCKEIHIFESAIDLLSYATLCKLKGFDWKQLNLVSLGGVAIYKNKYGDTKLPKVLERVLKQNKNIQSIIMHLDNDIAGRNASESIYYAIPNHIKVVDQPPRYGKDFNDFLCFMLKKERSLER